MANHTDEADKNQAGMVAQPIDIVKIRGILALIHDAEQMEGREGYSLDKKSISTVFKNSQGGSLEGELARLAMIDGMYSTQMNRRYYALEELAEMIVELRKGLLVKYNKKLEDVFIDFACQIDPDDSERQDSFIQKYFNVGSRSLWGSSYGIGKRLNDKGVAISLISKYAYFATEFKFPIYDTIACEVMPVLARKVFGTGTMKLKIFQQGSQKTDGEATIKAFIGMINFMKMKLDCESYDVFDRLLWYTGKMRRGNLSLILSREEYEKWFEELPLPRDEKAFARSIKTVTTERFMNCLASDRSDESRTMLKNLYDLARALKA